ncbi:thioredoxin-like domain-containing protein [Pedobacter sp. SYP-B3415]|uniref:thioredoxin-like domain-containing protein n=1 Tax=Pedobacter sp. SYP-B3415 TaxID=2496641 RepID=UPI00101B965B|nr:thioredoxin-like domain-containing protein [Pedobacter sp. SYP-B3415]
MTGKFSSLIYLFFLLFTFHKSQAQYKFNIHGEIPKELSSSMVYLKLRGYNFRLSALRDSAQINNQRFEFTANLSEPALKGELHFMSGGNKYITYFAVDPGDNYIKLEMASLSGSVFEKSGGHNISNLMEEKIRSIKSLAYKKRTAAALLPDGTEQSGRIFLESEKQVLDVIRANPTAYYSIITLYWSSKLAGLSSQPELILQTLEALDIQLRSSEPGIDIRNRLEANIERKEAMSIGKTLTAFSTTTDKGEVFDRATLQQNTHLFIFSASWCVPCQEQLPAIKKMYEQYKERGLRVVYVSNDTDSTQYEKYVRLNPAQWTNIPDGVKHKRSLTKFFNVKYLPTCVLIGKNGNIIYHDGDTDSNLHTLSTVIEKTLKNDE